MAFWEKVIYILALAFWRAYFDAREAISATEEVLDEKKLARARNFADAIRKLRDNAQSKSDPGPQDSSSNS